MTFYVDTTPFTGGRLLTSTTDTSHVNFGGFTRSDTAVPIAIQPRIVTATDTTTADFDTGDTFEFILGSPDSPPLAGTFTVTMGATTTAALPHNVSATDLQVALSAMFAANSEAECTVNQIGPGVWRVTGNSNGAITTLSVTINATQLEPTSNAKVMEADLGGASAPYSLLIVLRQTALAYATPTTLVTGVGRSGTLTINTVEMYEHSQTLKTDTFFVPFSIRRTRSTGEVSTIFGPIDCPISKDSLNPLTATPSTPTGTGLVYLTSGVAGLLTLGTGLSISGTTLNSSGGSGDVSLAGPNAFTGATNSFGSFNLDAVSSTIYGPDGLGLYASGGITYMSGGGGALLDLTSSAFTGDWTHDSLLMTISGTTSGGVTMAADAGDTLHEATGWGLNLGIGSNGAVTSYRAGESNWMFALERDYLTTQGVLQHEAYFEDNTAYPAHRPFIAAWSQQFNATVNSITAGVVVLASAPTNNYIRSGLRFKFPTLTGTVSGITANQFYYVKRRISATSFAFSSSVYSSAITFSVASPTQATCSAVAAHGFTNGQTVTIYGVTTGTFSGTVNGQQTITVTGTHTFTIDGLACTVAGSGGTVLGGSGAENTGGATAGGTMQRGGYGAAAFTMPAKVVAYSYDSVDITSVTAFEVNNQVASAATKVLLSNAVSGSAQAFIQTNSTFKFGQGAVYGGSSNSFDISSLNTGTTVDFSMNYTSGWVKMGYTSDASAVAPASRLDVNGTVTATSVTTQNLLAENGFPAVVGLSTGGGATGALTIQSTSADINLTNSTAAGNLNLTTASGAVTVAGNTITAGTGTLTLGTFTLTVPSTGTAVTTSTLSGGTLAGSFTTGAFSDTTDASSTTVAGLKTAGGLAVAKKLYVGTSINIPGATSGTATMTAGASNSGFVFSATPFSNSGAYGLIGVGWISGSSNGRFQLTATTATTGAISRLTFGTEDASTPQFRFSGTTITSGLGNATDGGAFVASGTLAVTGATTLTGNLTSNGAYISTPQALSGNGAVAAVSVATEITTIANTGTANTTTTLAAGTNGQRKIISFITDGGFDAVVTVTNPAWGGAGTITMNDALDNIMLIYLNSVWQVFINNGCTLA